MKQHYHPSPSPQMKQRLSEARKLYEQGKQEHADGHYAEAAKDFRQATLLQEVVLGKFHQDTIKSYWRWGRAAAKVDRREALQAFTRAARMADSTFTPKVIAGLWQDIQAKWREGEEETAKNDEALQQLAEVLQLEKQGDAHCKQGSPAKAMECYQRLLEIQDAMVGSQSLDGADIRCKLACCYLQTAQLDRAQDLLEHAHACFLTNFGEVHPATLGAAATIKTVQSRMSKDSNNKRASATRASSSPAAAIRSY